MKQLNQHSSLPAAGRFSIIALTASLLLASCQKEVTPPVTSGDAIAGKAASKAPAVVVHAGASIQEAINNADAGSTIKIEAGTYKESLVVNKPGMTLAGEDGVILQNPGDEEDGITVQDAGDGFTLKNITVRDFEENGVVLRHVDGFLLSHVTAIHNG